MNPRFPRRPRLKLKPESYRELRKKVLERDGWRCQNCGRLDNLEVHHQLGNDEERNLLTLCTRCHQAAHRRNL